METHPQSDPSSPEETAAEQETAEPVREYGKQGDGLDVEFSSPFVAEPVQYDLPESEILPRYIRKPFGRRWYDQRPLDPPGMGRRQGSGEPDTGA